MKIDRTDPFPVGKQAKLLGISRGTVYYLPRGLVLDSADPYWGELSAGLLGFGQLDLLGQLGAELLTPCVLRAAG